MGILPLEFIEGQDADSLGLTGFEKFSIKMNGGDITVGETVKVTTDNGKSFIVKARLDTAPEVGYFWNGGILHTVLRNLSQAKIES